MSIEEIAKRCGITCSKCLDTKLLWLNRHDSSDGRGIYQLYNCNKCGNGIEERVVDCIDSVNNRLIPPFDDESGFHRIAILQSEVDKLDEVNPEPIWAIRTESIVNFVFDATEDIIQNSIRNGLQKLSNHINVNEFFEKIYSVINFDNSLHRYVEQVGELYVFVQSEKRLLNNDVIPWYTCCVDPNKISIQLTIAIIKPKNVPALEECKKLLESYTAKPNTVQTKKSDEEKKENQA